MLFRCRTTCCLLYQQASLRYQHGCTACFTEKQRDLSILMPLWQSVWRPYFPKAAGQNQTTCPQIYPFLLFFPKTLTSCSSVQIFQPSLLLLIQPLDFIFYKILPALNIMMTADFLFLPRPFTFSSICSWSHFHQNFLPRPLPTKRIRVQLKDCTLMTLSHWSFSSQSRLDFFPINSRSFSCALHSEDSSWQVSGEKLGRYEHFN